MTNTSSNFYFQVFLSPIALISDMVSRQSLSTLQELADQQRQTLQIVVLLEAALLCFTKYKVPALSFFLALTYGQLLSLQSGYLTLSFALHGVIYGMLISLFLLGNKIIGQREPFWTSALFITLLIATYLTEANLPNTSVNYFNLNEMLVSLTTLVGTIFLGFVIQRIRLGNIK